MATTSRIRFLMVSLSLATLVGAPSAFTQSLPDGWTAVTDAGDATAVSFQTMAPGWHLDPGPAALIYEPGRSAEEPFEVELEAYRFPGDPSGYGIFLGGRGLEPDSYDFFEVLLDARGRYRLGHRAGPEYHEIVPWTAHEAIAVPDGDDAAHNVLTVEARRDRFAVSVNGALLTSFEPPAYALFHGVVGLRTLGDVNLHVVRLDVAPGAPAEAGEAP